MAKNHGQEPRSRSTTLPALYWTAAVRIRRRREDKAALRGGRIGLPTGFSR
jgi:hypothetical protein